MTEKVKPSDILHDALIKLDLGIEDTADLAVLAAAEKHLASEVPAMGYLTRASLAMEPNTEARGVVSYAYFHALAEGN